MAAKDRPFTQLAAEICGFKERLAYGLCPTCGGDADPRLLREDQQKEFKISGICSTCQDRIFRR